MNGGSEIVHTAIISGLFIILVLAILGAHPLSNEQETPEVIGGVAVFTYAALVVVVSASYAYLMLYIEGQENIGWGISTLEILLLIVFVTYGIFLTVKMLST